MLADTTVLMKKASLIEQYTLHGQLQTSAGGYYMCDTNCVHLLLGDVNNVGPCREMLLVYILYQEMLISVYTFPARKC